MPAPRYVIYTPRYESTNGGAIVMHKLCHLLNQMGQEAVVCAMAPLIWGSRRQRLYRRLFPKPFVTNPDFQTPRVKPGQLRPTDIVIYPELAGSNPLQARNVVYWLLNRPNFAIHPLVPSPGDLFFKYDDRCDEPELTGGKAVTLFLFSVNTTYRQTNFGSRQGSCFLVRKGVGRPLIHPIEGSVKIDGMPHDEVNRVFNEREIFYAYDEVSSYSQFAAICGCTSVVVPHQFKDQAEFAAAYPLSRYGVAYGEENIPHALATRHLVADYLRACEEDSLRQVRDFVSITQKHFGFV
jgi:hypothetical protein